MPSLLKELQKYSPRPSLNVIQCHESVLRQLSAGYSAMDHPKVSLYCRAWLLAVLGAGINEGTSDTYVHRDEKLVMCFIGCKDFIYLFCMTLDFGRNCGKVGWLGSELLCPEFPSPAFTLSPVTLEGPKFRCSTSEYSRLQGSNDPLIMTF